MRSVVELLIAIPTPLILVVATGLAFWRWRRLSFTLITVGTTLLVTLSLPVVGRFLGGPLAAEATSILDITASNSAAILVPTAGMFQDSNGDWWSTAAGIERAVTGQRLSERLNLPLILSGGAPRGESESEAKVLATQIGLSDIEVILEKEAKNTYETGEAAARILSVLGGDHVVLVTSPTHIARMAACLRQRGLQVTSVEAIVPRSKSGLGTVTDFLPSARGMARSRSAIHEYLAILFYLAQGYIEISDLAS